MPLFVDGQPFYHGEQLGRVREAQLMARIKTMGPGGRQMPFYFATPIPSAPLPSLSNPRVAGYSSDATVFCLPGEMVYLNQNAMAASDDASAADDNASAGAVDDAHAVRLLQAWDVSSHFGIYAYNDVGENAMFVTDGFNEADLEKFLNLFNDKSDIKMIIVGAGMDKASEEELESPLRTNYRDMFEALAIVTDKLGATVNLVAEQVLDRNVLCDVEQMSDQARAQVDREQDADLRARIMDAANRRIYWTFKDLFRQYLDRDFDAFKEINFDDPVSNYGDAVVDVEFDKVAFLLRNKILPWCFSPEDFPKIGDGITDMDVYLERLVALVYGSQDFLTDMVKQLHFRAQIREGFAVDCASHAVIPVGTQDKSLVPNYGLRFACVVRREGAQAQKPAALSFDASVGERGPTAIRFPASFIMLLKQHVAAVPMMREQMVSLYAGVTTAFFQQLLELRKAQPEVDLTAQLPPELRRVPGRQAVIEQMVSIFFPQTSPEGPSNLVSEHRRSQVTDLLFWVMPYFAEHRDEFVAIEAAASWGPGFGRGVFGPSTGVAAYLDALREMCGEKSSVTVKNYPAPNQHQIVLTAASSESLEGISKELAARGISNQIKTRELKSGTQAYIQLNTKNFKLDALTKPLTASASSAPTASPRKADGPPRPRRGGGR
jgi:hypothetical protein